MKIILLSCLMPPVIGVCQHGQNNSHHASEYIVKKDFIGTWRSEDDAKWILIFSNRICVSKYDSAIDAKSNYYISRSCNLKDTADMLTSDSNNNVYLLLNFPENNKLNKCYFLETISENTLSYFYENSGKMFVFDRMK